MLVSNVSNYISICFTFFLIKFPACSPFLALLSFFILGTSHTNEEANPSAAAWDVDPLLNSSPASLRPPIPRVFLLMLHLLVTFVLVLCLLLSQQSHRSPLPSSFYVYSPSPSPLSLFRGPFISQTQLLLPCSLLFIIILPLFLRLFPLTHLHLIPLPFSLTAYASLLSSLASPTYSLSPHL